MTKAQVKETLTDSAIYIDFGHHPGKDRVPREAAAMGAAVLLHDQGAGSSFVDHPLDRDYLFSLVDIRDGSLVARLTDILANPRAHFDGQRHTCGQSNRNKEFHWQVKSFFFDEE